MMGDYINPKFSSSPTTRKEKVMAFVATPKIQLLGYIAGTMLLFTLIFGSAFIGALLEEARRAGLN